MVSTHIPSCSSAWPELDYASWQGTQQAVHLWTQIVGKIRMDHMPWQNHSWHTTLYLSTRGFTTGSVPYQDGIFEIEFDFENHRLVISSTFHEDAILELKPGSVANFFDALFDRLQHIGVEVDIHAAPNELPHATPFAEDTEDRPYDRQKVIDFWQVAVSTHNVFQRFRSAFLGKCSPVHLFWGAFDIAVTRFSGRTAPVWQGQVPNMPLEVMQEAYSREVSSAGLWPGSPEAPMPIYYSYCYPSPDAFKEQPIQPAEASWLADLGEFILPYDAVRKASNPEAYLMEFLQSTYVAAAETGNWDRGLLER